MLHTNIQYTVHLVTDPTLTRSVPSMFVEGFWLCNGLLSFCEQNTAGPPVTNVAAQLYQSFFFQIWKLQENLQGRGAYKDVRMEGNCKFSRMQCNRPRIVKLLIKTRWKHRMHSESHRKMLCRAVSVFSLFQIMHEMGARSPSNAFHESCPASMCTSSLPSSSWEPATFEPTNIKQLKGTARDLYLSIVSEQGWLTKHHLHWKPQDRGYQCTAIPFSVCLGIVWLCWNFSISFCCLVKSEKGIAHLQFHVSDSCALYKSGLLKA